MLDAALRHQKRHRNTVTTTYNIFYILPKKYIMKKILCCIALTMMCSANADAQLGGFGKKLKDKVTSTVKDATKSKTEEVKSDAKQEVKTTTRAR